MLARKDSPTKTTPDDVVARAREGDEGAWETLFDLHYARLFRFFRARLSSSEQAEDLASNVFMEAFRSIQNFTWQGKPFEAWLFGIAKHQLASYYRSQKQVLTDVELGAEPAVRDEFIAVEIRDILERLPLEYRVALELRFIVGLSGAETAEVMGRSHGALRSLLFRAVKAFREESASSSQPLPKRGRRRNTEPGSFMSGLGDAR